MQTTRRRGQRLAVSAMAIMAITVSLGACTNDEKTVEFVDETPASAVVPGDDIEQTAVMLSSTLFDKADVAVVATEDDAQDLAKLSTSSHLPLLVGTDDDVAEELDRLGAGTVVVASGEDHTDVTSNREVVEVDPQDSNAGDAVPKIDVDEDGAGVSLLLESDSKGPGQAVARAQVEAARGNVNEMSGGDPRTDADTVAAAKDAAGADPNSGVLAFGDGFGSTEDLTSRLQAALSVPQLPGGGQLAFPGRRMVAAYGSPGIPSLGILGEQDRDATIDRVQKLADDYQPYSDEQVIPALEIITTVASASPGSDGNYSAEIDPEEISDWADAAADEGVYVVLDLQPGRSDFLTQAKKYEDLLKKPNVGLALDAEWRLKPDQKPLQQIGSVDVSEINETVDWLASLTSDNDLPQKVFILHQFNQSMITDRQDLDTSHPELTMLIHADGNGTPGMKMETWKALQKNLPDGVGMAWKNFYDEDTPTFTPEQTFDIDPQPWFVSYQ